MIGSQKKIFDFVIRLATPVERAKIYLVLNEICGSLEDYNTSGRIVLDEAMLSYAINLIQDLGIDWQYVSSADRQGEHIARND